jgi:hypothetical protein
MHRRYPSIPYRSSMNDSEMAPTLDITTAPGELPITPELKSAWNPLLPGCSQRNNLDSSPDRGTLSILLPQWVQMAIT